MTTRSATTGTRGAPQAAIVIFASRPSDNSRHRQDHGHNLREMKGRRDALFDSRGICWLFLQAGLLMGMVSDVAWKRSAMPDFASHLPENAPLASFRGGVTQGSETLEHVCRPTLKIFGPQHWPTTGFPGRVSWRSRPPSRSPT